MNDAADIVRDYLLAQGTITTLTGTRIWAESTYPATGYQPAQGGAIAFKNAGGSFQASNALLRNRWQFKVYGADVYQIRSVYHALMDVLHDAAGRGILGSQPEGPGVMLADSQTNWPFMLVFIETTIRSGLPTYSPV